MKWCLSKILIREIVWCILEHRKYFVYLEKKKRDTGRLLVKGANSLEIKRERVRRDSPCFNGKFLKERTDLHVQLHTSVRETPVEEKLSFPLGCS